MSDLHACAAKQVVSSPWGAPLLGSPSPFAESHAKDAPRQIPSKFRTSPNSSFSCSNSLSFDIKLSGDNAPHQHAFLGLAVIAREKKRVKRSDEGIGCATLESVTVMAAATAADDFDVHRAVHVIVRLKGNGGDTPK